MRVAPRRSGSFVLGCATAVAGDSATFAPFGYSEDRRYFAYEEFSIGDEGTPPLRHDRLVDLTTGALAFGSPWTASGSEEGGKTAHRSSGSKPSTWAAAALAEANPGDPAHFLALIGDGVRATRRRR